jgi:hypothetical protein
MARDKATIAALGCVALLAACNQTSAPANQTEEAGQEQAASPVEKVKSVIDCASAPRPDARADNDIMNIDLGMSADDAIKIAKCNKEGFAVAVETGKLGDGSTPRSLVKMTNGDDLVNIFLIGVTNQEKVFGLVRVKKFADGEEPTVEQMRASLSQKYGPLIATWTAGEDDLNERAQAFSSEGQPLPSNELGDTRCAYYFGQNNDLGQLNAACGLTKKISVKPKYGNDALAGGFSVWLGNQNAIVLAAREVLLSVQKAQQQKLASERQKAEASDHLPSL